MSKGKGPQTQVGGGVGYGTERVFNGVDSLVDEHFTYRLFLFLLFFPFKVLGSVRFRVVLHFIHFHALIDIPVTFVLKGAFLNIFSHI